jgi:hypothetical protein
MVLEVTSVTAAKQTLGTDTHLSRAPVTAIALPQGSAVKSIA